MTCKQNKGWDIDLEYGLNGERLVEEILKDKKKIEVKTDRIADKTGNIAVEYSYKGYRSGISTTESELWAFVLYDGELILLIDTIRLKKLARKFYKLNGGVRGGDDNQSMLVLIPIEELTKPTEHETGLHR